LLRMQTLYYEVLSLDEQIAMAEADLEAESDEDEIADEVLAA